MKSQPEIITRTIREGMNAYQKALESESLQYKKLDLDCSQLPTPQWSERVPFPPDLWEKLADTDKQPCLYYFEMIDADPKIVLSAFRKFKGNAEFSHRASPALKKNIPIDTHVLYVGKVKKHFAGRLFQHLGQYSVGATAGLQLAYWARDLGLRLRVHIFAFPPEMHHFVDPLELPFARSLNPMIGKH